MHTKQNTLYFKQLDGLRCIAVLSVLICHWITIRAVEVIPLGSMGVNLFFVLSGFLITRILLLNKDKNELSKTPHFKSIKQFYIRRSLRIFPIYFLTIFILFILNFEPARNIMGWLLTYTLNIKFSLAGVWESNELGYFVHLWSLCVEEQFYIIFPFIIFFIPKQKIKTTIYLLIAIGVLSRFLLWQFGGPKNSIYALSFCCTDAFGIGSLLAYYLLYEIDVLRKILSKNYLFVFSIVVFIICIVYSRNFIPKYGECRTVLERFLFCVCCFWIVGKAAINSYYGWFQKILENKKAIYLGKISYGIYIYHHFVEPLFMKFLEKIYHSATLKPYFDKVFYNTHLNPVRGLIENAGSILLVIILFSITLLIASLSWKYIEKPINTIKEKYNY